MYAAFKKTKRTKHWEAIIVGIMAHVRYDKWSSAISPTMTFSQFIKQVAEHVLAREFAMPLSGLALAIRNDPSCKYLQLKPITLHKILQSYPDSFKFQGAREDPEVSLRLSIDICNNVRNCPGFPQCKDLHICRYFMMDNCIHTKRKTRAPCPYPHSLDSKHNRKVRQYHNLLSLDITALKKRMQESADFASQEAPVDLSFATTTHEEYVKGMTVHTYISASFSSRDLANLEEGVRKTMTFARAILKLS